MAMDRALESASMSWLINHLASQQVIDFFLKWEIDSALIRKLTTLLRSVTAVLNGAEDRQVNDPSVKAWLDDLRDAIYEAEDLVDEIATRATQSELGTGKLTGPLHLSESVKKALDFKVKDVVDHLNPFKVPIESKIRGVVDRLEDISRQKDILRLTADGSNPKLKWSEFSGELSPPPRLTTPLVSESRVHGRDAEKEAIKSLLVAGEDELSVIPIVGMGGIGKTTLAKIVYNDEEVKGCFDLRAWGFVSDVFYPARILRTLIESSTGTTCNTNNLELLQLKMQDQLSGKKFLIVLDDVWNDEYGRWDDLRTAFENAGTAGSRIIVTTRNEKVARIMQSVPSYHLKELLEDASRSIFEQIAFPGTASEKYPNLRLIGREVVRKCKGLPLALKVLGGLLLQNMNEKYWRDILSSKIWDLSSNEILPALRLSYYHLPPHLKKCFAYCSMFPKGFEFNKETLVLLWVAEGFVQSPRERHDKLEDDADEFLMDLVSRSLFQRYSGEESTFVMHDLVHELAQFVSGKATLSLGNKTNNLKSHDSLEKTRHLSYIRGLYDAFSKFEALGKTKSLRTFLPLNAAHRIRYNLSCLTERVTHELLPSLRVLRVLSLDSYEITSIPDSIGHLKHLRYLDLSHSLVKELPLSVTTLYNLQTLILRGCKNLRKLPDDIGSLINLRHLILSNTDLQLMPLGMGRLVNLQSLTNFIVGKGCGSGIGELEDLSMLRGTLQVSGLHNVSVVKDARKAKLKAKEGIDELILDWGGTSDGLRDGVEIDIFDDLEPNERLRRLTIRYYVSPKFPTWLGDPSFCQMVYLRLYSCRKCIVLPALGMLPHLEHLIIEGMDCIKSVGPEFYGDAYAGKNPFPSLLTLKFEDMKEWEEWLPYGDNGIMGFPSLCKLYVFRCPKLSKLTGGFGSLEVLHIKNCASLTSFSECSTVETTQCPEYSHLQKLFLENCSGLDSLPASTPSLEVLHVDNCEKLTSIPRLGMLKRLFLFGSSLEVLGNLVDMSSLTNLELRHIVHMRNFPEGFLRNSQKLEELKVFNCNDLIGLSNDRMGLNDLSSLKKLIISQCYFFKSLPDEMRNLPPAITSLDIKHCENLLKLPSDLFALPLRELRVERCPKLEAFPESGLPPMLKRLEVQDCRDLKMLPGGILDNDSTLEYLELRSCSSLVSFLENGRLPTTLRHIKLAYCEKLRSLPQGIMSMNDLGLEFLEIDDCPALVSFPPGELPRTLKKLEIGECRALESLPVKLVCLTNLDTLALEGCHSLVGFPLGGLPPNLQVLRVSECEKLEVLPEGIHRLKCLQELNISVCPSFELIPRQGLPASLIRLSISNCPKLNPIDQWKLHKLSSLEYFSVEGCKGVMSFPSDYLLPDSLTSLHILEFPDLESLSTGLNNLTSLEILLVGGCSKLKLLPEDGLPSSLGKLQIRKCPLLAKECEADQGAEWPKIKSIPLVHLLD